MLALLAAAAPAPAPPASPAPPAAPASPAQAELPAGEALRAQIAAADAELFDTLFLRCEPAHMRRIVADDLEFYHDKDGATRGADAFVADYARFCTERLKPDAWRARRELVASSLVVDPVPGVGAVEAGEHVFYERKGEGPEKLVGRARFAQLWVLTKDGWRLSRVLSFSHRPAQ
ncbi:MAG: nuclear transport factor 2 family protein [Alphaproteobacteria bacterium]|nr:nuclear transport factor 2 family protein [Alphaproteobacteria bacterium]MBV9373366.1 nuclear transport factor 2 family protein [Alphaproteobacteria bacterium]MBV9902593.1 nuclear transport factor 2 family protein [Alphaproteobacteria bacterium]